MAVFKTEKTIILQREDTHQISCYHHRNQIMILQHNLTHDNIYMTLKSHEQNNINQTEVKSTVALTTEPRLLVGHSSFRVKIGLGYIHNIVAISQ